jgi:hypothetical protein
VLARFDNAGHNVCNYSGRPPFLSGVDRLLNAGSDFRRGVVSIQKIESFPKKRESFFEVIITRAIVAGTEGHSCTHAYNSEQTGVSDGANPALGIRQQI